MLRNTPEKFGLITKIIHWISAIALFALFALGYWMVGLDYYSPWYQTAPHWHESVGVLLLFATIFRLIWRNINVMPEAIITHNSQERKQAVTAQILLYILLFLIMFSGYLIPTADERSIIVFTWFELPSLGKLFTQQEDIAGSIHLWGAYSIMVLSLVHALAAIKHHFIDKDETLLRMLK